MATITLPSKTDLLNLANHGAAKTLFEDLWDFIIAALGDELDAGLRTEKVNLADDASHAFDTLRTTNQGDSLYVLFVKNLAAEQAIFFSGGSGQSDVGSGTAVTLGGASNPDLDNYLNIWVSGGYINVKNRLGGAYDMTLLQIKGNV